MFVHVICTHNVMHLYSFLLCPLPRVVDALIHYQSDTIQDEDEDSNSPLHLACINGHVEVAKVLIAAKCNIEARFVNPQGID